MRHGKTFNHLGRTTPHRKAMLQNMAVSLIMNKRINTTVAKAKALRKVIEPIITRSKDDGMHSRRMTFTYLQDKEAVKELFGTIAGKVADRPGGYTRIIKTGFRLGDAAEMCMMELVDFNELLLNDTKAKKAKNTRRGRTTAKKTAPAEVVAETPVVEAAAEEAPKAE
jgi:large subunit ribosomal protein L17